MSKAICDWLIQTASARMREEAESPIELLFWQAFDLLARKEAPLIPGLEQWASPQHTLDTHIRVDFLICDPCLSNRDAKTICVVECDGHEFHERTKEQAAKDRKRDRDLQDMGFKVYRFTGSELFANPFKCAEQVIEQCRIAILGDTREARALASLERMRALLEHA